VPAFTGKYEAFLVLVFTHYCRGKMFTKKTTNTSSPQKSISLENLINQDFPNIENEIIRDPTLITMTERYGRTLLHLASINNKLDVIKLLSKKNVDFSQKTPAKKNCLHYACEHESLGVIEWLIINQPGLLDEKDKNERTPLQLAIEKNISDKILVFLINQYIHNGDANIRLAIDLLFPPMKSWEMEHFLNYLGEGSEKEYSDDSDNEKHEEQFLFDAAQYTPEDLRKARDILQREGNFPKKNLSERLKTLMSKVDNDSDKLKGKIKDFVEAKDRRAYFPATRIPTELSASSIQFCDETFENEIDILNMAVESNTLKIRFSGEGESFIITIHGTHNNIPVEYNLKEQYYLPAFRGISYLVDRWNTGGRRFHRQRPLAEDFVNYAEANVLQDPNFYQRTDYLDIDLISLSQNAEILKTKLLEFKRSEPVIFTTNETKRKSLLEAKSTKLFEFQNYLDLLQYMFSNGIDNFLSYLEQFNEKFPGILPNSRNPLLPFGHLPFHALKYAFGDKNPYGDFALPPLWNNEGRPRKPHIGKVTLSIHPLRDFLGFDQPNIVPYLTQVAGVTASFDIGPEYEISFLSHIPKSRIFKQKSIRYPSFHHKTCPEKYLAKYGLNQTLYQGFRECILDPNTRENATNVLKSWLCLYHSIKSMEEVSEEISNRKGIMLFYHPDGTFHAEYPPEAYQTGSIDRDYNIAKQHFVPEKLLLRDEQQSWGFKDKRGIYKTDLTPTPRKSPSGDAPSGKRLDQSLSASTPYSPISSSDGSESNRSFSSELNKLNKLFSLLGTNDSPVITLNKKNISTSYWYEDGEMQMILQHQIDQHHRQTNDGRPIYLLGPLDNLNEPTLSQVLTSHNRNHGIVLIPFNLSQRHWVGLLLEYNNTENLIRANYYDSLRSSNLDILNATLRAIRRQEDLVDEFTQIQEENGLIRQQNGSDCGPCTIENLLRGAGLETENMPLDSASMRLTHLELLELRNPNFYRSFYDRQRTNQSSLAVLGKNKQIHHIQLAEYFSVMEYKNLLSLSLEILNLSQDIRTALIQTLQQKEDKDEEHSLKLTGIRNVLSGHNNDPQVRKLVNQLFYFNQEAVLEAAPLKLDYNQLVALGNVLTISKEEIKQDLRVLSQRIEAEKAKKQGATSSIMPNFITTISTDTSNVEKNITRRKLNFNNNQK